MIFGRKKKRMIDVGELVRRGRMPKHDTEVNLKANSDGFVEIGSGNSIKAQEINREDSVDVSALLGESAPVESSAMDFLNMSSTPSSPSPTFSQEADGYDKREVDAKISQLDSMIYKLEQRIDVLERKAGVGTGNSNTGAMGAMGW
ncbi:MAG: hypothetical protein ACI83O_000543 [Patescibacteria group bacterium]|jgi:hypothetical protein